MHLALLCIVRLCGDLKDLIEEGLQAVRDDFLHSLSRTQRLSLLSLSYTLQGNLIPYKDLLFSSPKSPLSYRQTRHYSFSHALGRLSSDVGSAVNHGPFIQLELDTTGSSCTILIYSHSCCCFRRRQYSWVVTLFCCTLHHRIHADLIIKTLQTYS